MHETKNPVAFYFQKAKDLEMPKAYFEFFSREAEQLYTHRLRETYNILYDRIMTSPISSFLKQEAEEWYSYNINLVGSASASEINRDLESMLRRFNFI